MKRQGMTGIETAIILVAFVIVTAAFGFIILNMGFLTADKSQSVISSSMGGVSSALQADSGVVGSFHNVSSSNQDDICLVKLSFYIKISEKGELLNLASDHLVITYSNPRCHANVYESNGTITTLTCISGDSDSLIEAGEKFKVEIDLTELPKSSVDPVQSSRPDLYAHPYEEFSVELKPEDGPTLTLEKHISSVGNDVVVFN